MYLLHLLIGSKLLGIRLRQCIKNLETIKQAGMIIQYLRVAKREVCESARSLEKQFQIVEQGVLFE